MEKITFITANNCSYCKKARNLLNRIKILKPEFNFDLIETIDIAKANQKKIICEKLPCFYLGDERVHEGYVTIDRLMEILKAAEKEETLSYTSEE